MSGCVKSGSELGQRLMVGASLAMVILLAIGLAISDPASAAGSKGSTGPSLNELRAVDASGAKSVAPIAIRH